MRFDGSHRHDHPPRLSGLGAYPPDEHIALWCFEAAYLELAELRREPSKCLSPALDWRPRRIGVEHVGELLIAELAISQECDETGHRLTNWLQRGCLVQGHLVPHHGPRRLDRPYPPTGAQDGTCALIRASPRPGCAAPDCPDGEF